MVNVNHSTLTDPYLHEPKGVSSASASEIYVANGSGSGAWKPAHNYINGYIQFDKVTPAYQHSVTTVFTPINPTFAVSLASGWTGATTPNARLVYTGTEAIIASINFSLSLKNNSGTARDVELTFYKNGTVLNGGHLVVTAASGDWKSATLTDYGSFNTNDYLEVFVKADSDFTLDVATASLTIMGVPS